jgi:hypothetical protein
MMTKRIVTFALASALLAAPLYLAAQDQSQGQESVADAARRARAEKKDAPKAKLTIDNDNLGSITGVVSVVGQEPAAPDDQSKNNGAQKPATPGEKSAAKDEAYWRQRFAEANKKLADDSRELDIMQREFNLKQQQFYTDPMAALKQDYSRQDINDSRTKIDDKTAAVAADKQDLSNLDDELRKAGGDPGWESSSDQSNTGTAPSPTPTPAPGQAPAETQTAPASPAPGSPPQND